MVQEQAVEALPQKKQKKIKLKSANREKFYRDVENGVGDKGIESALTFEEEAVLERKKQKKGNKDKKISKRMGDAEEVEMDRNGDVCVFVEDGNVEVADNDGGKKTKDKKKKREKNRGFEEAELNEGHQVLEEEIVSEMKSQSEAKFHKVAKNHKHDNGEKGGEKGERDKVLTSSVNCEENVVEKIERKKRKREKEKDKEDEDVWGQEACNESILESKPNNIMNSNEKVEAENESRKISKEGQNDDVTQKIDKKKKQKKKAGIENDERDSSVNQPEYIPENVEGSVQLNVADGSMKNKKKRMKKKDSVNGDPSLSQKHSTDESCDSEVEDANEQKKKKAKLVEDGSNDPTPNKSNKKVRFSGQDEVFPLPYDSNTETGKSDEENLVRGKRFTKEEDEIAKEAVQKYIAEHDLGEEGLNMVLNCKKHPELKGCWKEIGAAIPYRPYSSVYYRAQLLFRSSETRQWTKEEYEKILKHHEGHGNEWKAVADELGKHRWHVKDAYRRIKFQNLKKGHWSQEEYQKLFDLVNADLQLKLTEEKKSKHGMLRDNISWSAISEQLATRYHSTCCLKWYNQLTSPMVKQGVWADADDYRLLGELYSLDASCMEDVDWDNLLHNRSGDICKKRWNQMVLHIGHHGNKSFADQVEVLAQRYCPKLIEAREIWDSKPRVP